MEQTRLIEFNPQVCCDDEWEKAYLRFETPEDETLKFISRLTELGARNWSPDAEIVELFCGRGNGLHALERLGFTKVEGIDLSASLLAQYRGPAKCSVGDCRDLPLADESKDIVIVQGGLHHLLELPADLDKTLVEMRRVLRPGGLAVVVEPWLTPFLRLVHAACRVRLARQLSNRIDALATMICLERSTYESWLARPKMVLDSLGKQFEPVTVKTTWGKLRYVGRKGPVIVAS